MSNDNKFSKFTKMNLDKKEPKKTDHGDLQTETQLRNNRATTLTISLTFAQRQELEDYAKADDRSMGYVIKKILLEKGIISDKK